MSNKFEDNCNNICLWAQDLSKFGSRAHNISAYQGGDNVFGPSTFEIFFRASRHNVFGYICRNIVLGTNCDTNVFCSGVNDVIFGGWCYSNKLERSVVGVTFGNYCSFNDIDEESHNITFGNNFRSNTIGKLCKNVTLNTAGGSQTNNVKFVRVCDSVENLTAYPTRNATYEQIYYRVGRVETVVN